MTGRAPRLLVVQHEDNCPPGWVGTWLEDAGVELDVRHGYLGHEVPATLDAHDGLLVLGGAMDAWDDEHHPWLAPTRSLAALAIRTGAAYLGVCLGMQVATLGLGGAVVRNPAGYTRGVVPVRLTKAGRADRLLGGLGPTAVAVHYNQDMVQPPPGVAVLAETADGAPQLLRFGPRAWGAQCHPEVGPEIFDGWTTDKPAETLLTSWPSVADARSAADGVREAWPLLEATWRPVAQRFGALLTEVAQAR